MYFGLANRREAAVSMMSLDQSGTERFAASLTSDDSDAVSHADEIGNPPSCR